MIARRAAVALGLALALARVPARANDEWGDPPPPPPPAARGDEWGDPPADPRVPRLSTRTTKAAGRTLRFAVPEGWTASTRAEGQGAVVAIGDPRDPDVGLVVVALPARDPSARTSWYELSKELPDLARRMGFEPRKGPKGEPETEYATLGGYDAPRVFADRATPGRAAASAFVMALEAGGARVVVAGTAPAARFDRALVTLLLAAHDVAIVEAPPEHPLRPVVLDAPRPPSRPLEGWWYRTYLQSRYDALANVRTLEEEEDDYGFFPGGLVVLDHIPLDFARFDVVKEAALRPARVGAYEFDGARARIRRATGKVEEVAIEPSADDPGESLRIGGQWYRRADLDFAGLALEGTYTYHGITVLPSLQPGQTGSVSSVATITFRRDGTYEEAGETFLSSTTPATDAQSGVSIVGRTGEERKRGRYALGRGTIAFTRADGEVVVHRLRIGGPHKDPRSLDCIAIGGRSFLRKR